MNSNKCGNEIALPFQLRRRLNKYEPLIRGRVFRCMKEHMEKHNRETPTWDDFSYAMTAGLFGAKQTICAFDDARLAREKAMADVEHSRTATTELLISKIMERGIA